MASDLDRYPRDHEARREFLSRNLNRVAHALGGALFARCLLPTESRQRLCEDLEKIINQDGIEPIVIDDERFCACAIALHVSELALKDEESASGTMPPWHRCLNLKEYLEAGIEYARDGVFGERTPESECDRAMRTAMGYTGQIGLPVATSA